ncbi:hypothetical protein D3C72_1989400 [compost metagenome]
MQPADRYVRFDKIRQVLFDQPCKYVESIGVYTAHGANICAEVPPFNEPRQCQLRHGGRVAVQKRACHGHRLHQLRRQHEIADPQARKERFGERADIDSAVVRI